jgi:hypothetical protein
LLDQIFALLTTPFPVPHPPAYQRLLRSYDYFSISSQEINQLANYFYTLELMIRCKEAAVRVSPQVWAGIESRMVTIPYRPLSSFRPPTANHE